MNKKVNLTWKGQFRFTTDANENYSIESDLPPAMGGTGKGASPMEQMLSALGACSAMSAVNIISKKHAEITSMDVVASGDVIQKDNIMIFSSFSLKYSVVLKDKSHEETIREAVRLSHDKYCSVAHMYENIAPVTYELVIA